MHRTARTVRDPGLRRLPAASRARRPSAATAAAALLLALTACSGPEPAEPRAAASDEAAEAGPRTGAAPSPSTGATDAPVPPADENSVVGALPDGFPVDLLPVPDGAEILVATFAPEGQAGAGQPYTVSLNVRTSSSVEDVLTLYRSSLTAAGFTESTSPPTAALAAESTFSRAGGAELLVVGVLDRDGSRTVTIGGRIRSAA